MFKLNKQIVTKTYEVGNGFRVEVTSTDNYRESYIYHKDYGIKSLMFGSEDYEHSFLEVVESNLDDYIASYIEEVMDETYEEIFGEE